MTTPTIPKEVEALAENYVRSIHNRFQYAKYHVIRAYTEGHNLAAKEIARLTEERDILENLARKWMQSYDDLQEKYELLSAVLSKTKDTP